MKTIGSLFIASLLAVSLSAQIEVASDGKVGIGTASPAYPLHVEGNIYSTSGVIGSTLWVSDSVRKISASTDLLFRSSAGTPEMIIDDSGKVGIGTTSPTASLDIWKSYSAGTDSLRLSYNDGFDYWMGIQAYVVGAGNVGYKFRTNNDATTVDALNITGDGKIGVGTAAPAAKLHVAASGFVLIDPTEGSIEIGSGNDGTSFIDFRGSANLSSDFRGRVLYSDGAGFSFATGGSYTPAS
jgi:hypothetical protein